MLLKKPVPFRPGSCPVPRDRTNTALPCSLSTLLLFPAMLVADFGYDGISVVFVFAFFIVVVFVVFDVFVVLFCFCRFRRCTV